MACATLNLKKSMKAITAVLLAICSSLAGELRAADTAAAAAPADNPAPPPSAPAKLSAAELEKLAMPMALYPDPLIAVMLPAAVYPLEIVEAARFVKDTNNIAKVDEKPWDDNVKEVAKIPDLIAKMDADLNWTVALGQAFLDQRKELMDTIQSLRTKASSAGTLQTTPQQIVVVTNTVVEKVVEQQTVVVTNTVVEIQPANPQTVYVPSYPPTVYYPPPGYVYNPYAPLVTFGLGMAAGAIIANNWNSCNWHGGDVDVDVNRNVNRNSNRNVNRSNTSARTNQKSWQPNQSRMRNAGAPSASAQNRAARGYGSGPGGAGGAGGARASQMSSPGGGGARPSQQASFGGSQRPSAGTQPARSPSGGQGVSAGQRPASGGGARPSASSSSVGRGGGGSGAFGGVGSGSSARSASSRGAASRGGGGGGGARGGGGGGRRR
jgi:hypothetical protein